MHITFTSNSACLEFSLATYLHEVPPLFPQRNLLLLTAVLAFGTCGGYTGRNVVSIFCGGSSNETLSATFTYPFRFETNPSLR
uniref:Uncharacterized protein n=1 Tax=Sinocyclocheilus rhinocerous TaxID=307959 RepID=A0A673JUU9_9TELE